MTPAGVQAAAGPAVSPPPSPPRVVIRDDLRPAVRILLLVALLGIPLGLLWSWLAPPEIVTVLIDPSAGRVGVLPLTGQSAHRFDGMAIFLLLGTATGVLTGAALWLLRQRRGPVVLVAAVLGSLAAAWLAMRVGLWLVQWRYPGPAGAQHGDVVARPPVLESAWVLVAQPLGVALAYSLAAAWNGTDDLGRGPS
jgi:hypothetical protein